MKITTKEMITTIDFSDEEKSFLTSLLSTLNIACNDYKDCSVCPLQYTIVDGEDECHYARRVLKKLIDYNGF